MDKYLEPYEIKRNTEAFRKKYCFPYLSRIPRPKVVNAEVINMRFDDMIELYQLIDKQDIQNYIRSKYSGKAYNDDVKGFTSTFGWEVIRTKKKLDAGWSCSTTGCTSDSPLVVHHKTYEHWGRELDYLDDLVVLCAECHEAIHQEQGDIPYQPYKRRKHRRKGRFKRKNNHEIRTPMPIITHEDQEKQLKETEKYLQNFHESLSLYRNRDGLIIIMEEHTVDELWDIIDSQLDNIYTRLSIEH
jgi:hypothetical protein